MPMADIDLVLISTRACNSGHFWDCWAETISHVVNGHRTGGRILIYSTGAVHRGLSDLNNDPLLVLISELDQVRSFMTSIRLCIFAELKHYSNIPVITRRFGCTVIAIVLTKKKRWSRSFQHCAYHCDRKFCPLIVWRETAVEFAVN